jgi:hypothetical protein
MRAPTADRRGSDELGRLRCLQQVDHRAVEEEHHRDVVGVVLLEAERAGVPVAGGGEVFDEEGDGGDRGHAARLPGAGFDTPAARALNPRSLAVSIHRLRRHWARGAG